MLIRSVIAWLGLSLGLSLGLVVLPGATVWAASPVCAATEDATTQQYLLAGLALRSAQLRSVGVLEPGKIPQLFGANPQAFPDLMIYSNRDSTANAVLWSYFFQTSQSYLAHAYSGRPMVAFYSALMDLWWLSEWEYSDEDFKLVASSLWSAAALPRDEREELPAWLRDIRQHGLLKAIEQQVQHSVWQFQNEHPENRCETSGWIPNAQQVAAYRQLFARRASVALLGLSEFAEQSQDSALQEQLQQSLVLPAGQDPAAELNLTTTARSQWDQLRRLPIEYRQDLVAAFVLDLDQRLYVLSANASQGRYFILSEWERKGTQRSLSAVGALDAFRGVQP